MGYERNWFAGVADVELLFPKNDRENNYLIHNCYVALPKVVQDYEFDAVFMMSTFMDKVTQYGLQGRWIRQFDFLKKTSATKIVFPQDDYWHSEIRDSFYVDWGIHKVFPVCPPESWPELIPRYLEMGGSAELGYTTYITNYMKRISRFAKPWNERALDVVYRAKRTPGAPNHFGVIKGIIGDRFLSSIGEDTWLKCDVSTDPRKLIRGDSWYEFMGASRAILGSNSGSSIRLRNKEISLKLQRYQNENPECTSEEVEEAVIPPIDRNKSYTAISPRNLEAAMLGTVQILVPGEYGGFLIPHEDYIPLMEDCSNIDQVLDRLRDHEYCVQVASSCERKLLNAKELDANRFVESVIEFVRAIHADVKRSNNFKFEELLKRHKQQLTRLTLLYGIGRSASLLSRVILPRHIETKLKNFCRRLLNN